MCIEEDSPQQAASMVDRKKWDAFKTAFAAKFFKIGGNDRDPSSHNSFYSLFQVQSPQAPPGRALRSTSANNSFQIRAEQGLAMLIPGRSPLTFAGPDLEKQFQIYQATPDFLLNAAMFVALCIKVFKIAGVLKRGISPEIMPSIWYGVISTTVVLSVIVLQQYYPALFRKFWRHLSLLHIVTSAVHAMSNAPILARSNRIIAGQIPVPMLVYVRMYLESSSVIPLIMLSITSMLPLWPIITSYIALVFVVAPMHNVALCREIQGLPGQPDIFMAAGRAMQTVADACGMLFSPAPVHVSIPSPPPCELVMQACQIGALMVVVLILVAREAWSRRLFMAKTWAQRYVTAADRNNWTSHSSGFAFLVSILAQTLYCEFATLWYILLLGFPLANITTAKVLNGLPA
eukprot:jgi/Botrbrau1/8799/Bobra.0330s0030.1